MVEIENEIYSAVANAVRAEFPGIFVTGVSTSTPASFPCVSFEEIDNYTYARTLDTSGEENHAVIAYEINVYSNLKTGQKTQCKSIISIIDSTMTELGFLRTGKSPSEIPNANNSIYRMVARYRATVSKNNIIFRR